MLTIAVVGVDYILTDAPCISRKETAVWLHLLWFGACSDWWVCNKVKVSSAGAYIIFDLFLFIYSNSVLVWATQPLLLRSQSSSLYMESCFRMDEDETKAMEGRISGDLRVFLLFDLAPVDYFASATSQPSSCGNNLTKYPSGQCGISNMNGNLCPMGIAPAAAQWSTLSHLRLQLLFC